jgi:hypothetical protein
MFRSLTVSGACLVGLVVAGCCPKGSLETSETLRRLGRLQHSLRKIQRSLHSRNASLRGGYSGKRETEAVPFHRGACSYKDQLTCLAMDQVKIEADLAALKLSYRAKHPKIAALKIRLVTIQKYQSKLGSLGGQRVDACQLAYRLLVWAFRIESKHVVLSTRYQSKHPRIRSTHSRLTVVKAAVKAARLKCTKKRAGHP